MLEGLEEQKGMGGMLGEQIAKKEECQKSTVVNTSAVQLEVLSKLVLDQQKRCYLSRGWNYSLCCRCQEPGAFSFPHPTPSAFQSHTVVPLMGRVCLEGRWQGSLEKGVCPCKT